jgi:hypothetical protein
MGVDDGVKGGIDGGIYTSSRDSFALVAFEYAENDLAIQVSNSRILN